MLNVRVSQLKPLAILTLFLLLWWLTPLAFKHRAESVFHEFQAPLIVAESYMRELRGYWSMRTHSKQTLLEAGRDLSRINAAHELSRQRMTALEAENERLRELLRMPPEQQFQWEVARVARRDINAWWQQLIIRKGSKNGIVEGAAVVSRDGVVGRITEVGAYTSIVELVSSPGFRMAARFVDDQRPVTYQGVTAPAFAPPRGEVLNVAPDITASRSNPAILVSTHLGGVFPEGITIGEVADLSPGPDGYFQRGRVRLNPRLTELSEVTVLIPLADIQAAAAADNHP